MKPPKPNFRKAKKEMKQVMKDIRGYIKMPKIEDIFKDKKGKALTYIKKIQETDTLVIIRLKGFIDSYTIPILVKFGKKDSSKTERYLNKHILLDFKDVTHIDSATLASLIQLLNELKARHRKLGIVNATLLLKNYLRITRLESLIRIYKSEKAALEDLT